MKKITILILLISCVIIWSCSKNNPTRPGTGGGGGQTDTTELKYDDGTPDIVSYWTTYSSGSALRMTMPTGKATYKIISFSVYLGTTQNGNTEFGIFIFSMTGSIPSDSQIADYTYTSGTENTWNKHNISSSNITFNGGEDFVIGMGWDGVNQPTLGTDTISNGRGWYYTNDQWSQTSWSYFIRAYVENQVTGEIIGLNPSKSQSNY